MGLWITQGDLTHKFINKSMWMLIVSSSVCEDLDPYMFIDSGVIYV